MFLKSVYCLLKQSNVLLKKTPNTVLLFGFAVRWISDLIVLNMYVICTVLFVMLSHCEEVFTRVFCHHFSWDIVFEISHY